MNIAYLSALSALAGSAVGALASFATTWLTQYTQNRTQQINQMRAKRESLYGDFLDEASRLFNDAYTHEMKDLSSTVHIYALVAKIRLFASPTVVKEAEAIVREIVVAYSRPPMPIEEVTRMYQNLSTDPLHGFSESCRLDLMKL